MKEKFLKIEPGIKRRTLSNGDYTYHVRIKDKFKAWYPLETFSRLVDARRYKESLIIDRRNGITSWTAKTAKIVFASYSDTWCVECRTQVSQGWRISQNQMLRDYILPVLGSLQLDEVTPRDIQMVLVNVQSMRRSSQTLRHVYNLMRKMFGDAMDNYDLRRNPVLAKLRPKVPKTTRKYLKPEEVVRLLNAVKGHYLEPAIYIGLLAGLRPGEIQALKWSSIDLERNSILICEAYNRKEKRINPYPKQGNWGRAVIPAPLRDYLLMHRKESICEYVVCGPTGNMLCYGAFNRQLKAFCKRLAITVVTPHELRHSTSELWVLNGASKEDCGRQLNHTSSSVTERYMHRTDGRLAQLGAQFKLPSLEAPMKPRLSLVPSS